MPFVANDISNFLVGQYFTSTNTLRNTTQRISNVYAEESYIGMVKLTNLDYNSVISQNLIIDNLTYVNSEFEYPHELVITTQLATAGSYDITMNDVTFRNLTFIRGGKLMNFRHQTSKTLKINGLVIEDVTLAGIFVESFDENSYMNFTKIQINNFSTSNVFGGTTSLINVFKGAILDVYDSEFTEVSNSFQGAVAYAGSRLAQASFHNSNFTHNYAVEGSVFASGSESNIACHNCIITQNFAVISGVAKVNADGMFSFYDSSIYQNDAMIAPVSEIFSTQLISILNNSTVTNNRVLSKEQVLSQILTRGNVPSNNLI